ncbi:MAG: metallophosphoesterase family protein [Planctomycetota bacterium]|nr:metallophosphoesterase family protein [Planctomycetota bacterium]
MRTLVIGDIHGCNDALLSLVEAIVLAPEDRLITLGDYVDRGPSSREVVDWLINWSKTGNLIPLLGNHEIMMASASEDSESRSFWSAVGGAETIDSYTPAGAEKSLDHVPKNHWEFFDRCLPWYETESHIFVHAGLVANVDLDHQPEFSLFWERFENPQPHRSGKVMVCGHSPQDSGLPANLGHAVCIDTAACAGGWLTCLEPETGHYWQANQAGARREDTLRS